MIFDSIPLYDLSEVKYQFGTRRRPDVSLTAHWHVIIWKKSDCSSSPTCCFVTSSQVHWNDV